MQVPPLAGLGLDCAGATKLLAADHFVAKCPALVAYNAAGPDGQVINWSYDGRLNAPTAPYGSTIAVAVSKGKPPVPVPTVAAGSTFTQAQSALEALGLQATQVPQGLDNGPRRPGHRHHTAGRRHGDSGQRPSRSSCPPARRW